jgi:hypothetical protein
MGVETTLSKSRSGTITISFPSNGTRRPLGGYLTNLQNWYKEDGSLKEPPAEKSFEMSCAGCHNTGLELKKVDKGYESKYVELNIGCEKCHGPGSEHIKSPKVKRKYYPPGSPRKQPFPRDRSGRDPGRLLPFSPAFPLPGLSGAAQGGGTALLRQRSCGAHAHAGEARASAVIASGFAAEFYNLMCVEEGVEDYPGNFDPFHHPELPKRLS